MSWKSFENCTALRSLTLPDNVVLNESTPYLFSGCEALTVTYKGGEYNYTNFGTLYKAIPVEYYERDE